MKTKTKVLAVVEIAIVLCSLVVVAIPAIAAAASEIYEPGPLDVFGNANGDDTIDMRDTTYIKLVIFGKKPKTDLADANHDGKVSMLDVGQTKLIILGKEKELTYIDLFGEAETVNKPIKRLANLGYRGIIMARSLDAMDILLPICYGFPEEKKFFPEIHKWPAVGGSPPNIDYEMILSLNADAVQPNIEGKQFLVGGKGERQKRILEEKLPGIPIICLNMREQNLLPENVRTYGYIIDKKDEAEEFIDWFEGSLNFFKARTEGLSEDEKPRVIMTCEGYGEPYKIYCSGSRYAMVLTIAGGRNIADNIAGPDHPNYGHVIDVDPEWLIEQNLEYIFIGAGVNYIGYETDDPSKAAAYIQELMEKHPELANTNAVKNGHVYVMPWRLLGGAGNTIPGSAYAAKLLHPDLFEDFNPQAFHQDYVDRFLHIDFNVYEHGVFVYPPLE